jgi:hypothetical protein
MLRVLLYLLRMYCVCQVIHWHACLVWCQNVFTSLILPACQGSYLECTQQARDTPPCITVRTVGGPVHKAPQQGRQEHTCMQATGGVMSSLPSCIHTAPQVLHKLWCSVSN